MEPLPKPTNDSQDLEDWTINNHLLVTWIKLTIKPKLRSNISHKEVAKDLWDHIKKRFSLKSGAWYQQLRVSLSNCREVESTVEDYFGWLTRIRDSMAECLSRKTHGSGKCECNLVSAPETENHSCSWFPIWSERHSWFLMISDLCAISSTRSRYHIPNDRQNETVQLNSKTKTPSVLSFSAQAPTQKNTTVYNRHSSMPR